MWLTLEPRHGHSYAVVFPSYAIWLNLRISPLHSEAYLHSSLFRAYPWFYLDIWTLALLHSRTCYRFYTTYTPRTVLSTENTKTWTKCTRYAFLKLQTEQNRELWSLLKHRHCSEWTFRLMSDFHVLLTQPSEPASYIWIVTHLDFGSHEARWMLCSTL